LNSVLDQGLKDLEVVVGDDLSTDDTLEIARRRGDPRVRILPFKTRAGMSRNWSRCLTEARGKYVALVAQDDLLLPQWGERLVELLESHPEADLAFGRRNFGISDERSRTTAIGEFFETKYPAMLEQFYGRIETVIPPEVMIDAAFEHGFEVNLIGEPSFTMIRRDHPEMRVGYHPEMKQLIDWEFAARFFLNGPILHCPEEIGTYRIHAAGSSMGSSPLVRQHRDYQLLLESVLNRSPGRLSEAQTAFLRERIAERQENLYAYVRALESEREHLRGHVQNLERILRKIHGMRTYRFLCRINDMFGRRKAR
jgi:glycosyltransferase involved in cell wall biosynthesis